MNREFSSKLSELMHKYEEKDIEIKNLKGKNEEKNKEINQLIEKLNAFQENLSSENTLKDKKEAKLQLIEKELQEIKKLTDLKEV